MIVENVELWGRVETRVPANPDMYLCFKPVYQLVFNFFNFKVYYTVSSNKTKQCKYNGTSEYKKM